MIKLNENTIENIKQMIEDAPVDQKSTVIAQAIQQYVDNTYANLVEQYQVDFINSKSNEDDLAKFGLRNLSSDETQFYDKLINQELKGNENVLLPVKTVNYVFEDLKLNHPLFSHLDFAPAGIEKWIISEHTGKLVWGKITSAITSELEAEIKKFDIGVHMLSAFMFIPKGILDLGHAWIDRFVRTILQEALEDGLEEGYLKGDGKESPIGMDKDLSGSVVEGVYPKKTAIAITDFGVDSFNTEVLPILNRSGKRIVNEIIIVANQNDIDTSIYKATHVLGFSGYVNANLPKKFVFVPSVHMKAGEAIAFLPKTYAAGATRLAIDVSKEYKFLERLNTYAIVGYGNGRAKANDNAVLLDITGLEPLAPFIGNAAAGAEDEGA